MKDEELIEKVFLNIKKRDIFTNRNDILNKLETILSDRKKLKLAINDFIEIFNKFPSRFYQDWCYLLKKDSVSDKEIYSFLGTYSILDTVYSIFKTNLKKI